MKWSTSASASLLLLAAAVSVVRGEEEHGEEHLSAEVDAIDVPNVSETAVDHALEKWDEDGDNALSEEEVGDMLSGLLGDHTDACPSARALMDYAGVPSGENATSTSEINNVLANLYPCADAAFTGATIVVKLGKKEYVCESEEAAAGGHEGHRRMLEEDHEDHGHGSSEENEEIFIMMGGTELHCFPEVEEIESVTASGKTWGNAIGAALVTAFASLIGVSVLLCIGSGSIKKTLLNDAIAFAFGVLISTVLMHLIPESIGEDGVGEFTWQLGAALTGGVFAAWSLELVFDILGVHHDHSHAEKAVVNATEESKQGDLVQVKVGSATKDYGLISNIVFGDAFHNLTDGFVIGVAFLYCSSTGWIVTAAILAHEIPQEMVDFIILLRAGLSIKMALLWNFLSSLSAVIGVCIVLSLGTDISQSTLGLMLIFGSGFLLYVSMSQLIPLLKEDESSPGRKAARFALALVGVGLVGVLSIFHEHCEAASGGDHEGHDH